MGTGEGKAGQKSEFSQAGQGLTCEKAAQQGSEGTRRDQCSVVPQEGDSCLPEGRGEPSDVLMCWTPPSPQSFDYRVNRLRKQPPASGSDPQH